MNNFFDSFLSTSHALRSFWIARQLSPRKKMVTLKLEVCHV